MKIQINEVWNKEGRTVKLAEVESPGFSPDLARKAVWAWIDANRPDLNQADTIDAHGYHAIAVA